MLTIDANVWVAAADHADGFYEPSRSFLMSAARQRLSIYLPAFAWVEIACALARRRQDGEAGRRLTNTLLDSPQIIRVPLDTLLLDQALQTGTHSFLRGADALYVATAVLHHTQLVSWDDELVRRAQAITPLEWAASNL